MAQFKEAGFAEEAHRLLTYLQQYGYVTETAVVEALVQLYLQINSTSAAKAVAVSIQKPGKSEQKLAYRPKPHITLYSIRDVLCILAAATVERPIVIFCFDDCIGSGESLENYLFNPIFNPHSKELMSLFRESRVKLNVVTYHADVRAMLRLEMLSEAYGLLKVWPFRIVDDNHRAFSASSQIFRIADRRNEFMRFCQEVGEHLFPGNPLGWDDCQWCICYDYSIPDNSLPILYGSSDGDLKWAPLFERVR